MFNIIENKVFLISRRCTALATRIKIKIAYNTEIRKEIDELYRLMDKVALAKWALSIAKHILETVDIDYKSIDEIVDGFRVNELWQIKKATIHEVRQAGFKIHKIARESDNEITKTALRVVGQAVSSGHMREHAMVASDYAVKVIGLVNSSSIEAISIERKWQILELS
jgi:hypothetical protein